MSLLMETKCRRCGTPISVPAQGSYRIQCDSCSAMNILVATKVVVKDPLPPSTPKTETVEEVTSEPVSEEVEETVEEFPHWTKSMLKSELVAIAEDLGIDTDDMLKDDVVHALEKAEADNSE